MLTVITPPASKDDCATDDRDGVAIPTSPAPGRVEVRTLLIQPAMGCDTSGADPDDPNATVPETPAVQIDVDPCLTLTPLGPNHFKLGLKGCGGDEAGLQFDQCNIKIENGIVKQFVAPIITAKSSDNSAVVTKTGCELDVRLNPILTALPTRVLCLVGACPDAGRAMGIVTIVPVEGGGFRLEGCALAGEGATASALAYDTNVFTDLAAAVAAMNGATLSAALGSCGGGGG